MNRSSAYWSAFWVGLAGPATIYSAPGAYWNYVNNRYTVAQNFAFVGGTLSAVMGIIDGRELTGIQQEAGADGSNGTAAAARLAASEPASDSAA
jgi:hypothetical protein